MYNLGFGLPLLELWCISLYYFGLIFNFHVIPLVLSTQCDCLDLLITLLTGVCLQHFTIVSEAVSSYYCDDTIQYDSVYLTCSKKLTGSQLSLPHGPLVHLLS